MGFAGKVSLAQGAFMGIGAYTSVLLVKNRGRQLLGRYGHRRRAVYAHRRADWLSGAAGQGTLSRFCHACL